MPAGNSSLQFYTSTNYTTQTASAYKANLDANSSIAGCPAGFGYVTPNNPAGMTVLTDVGFAYSDISTGFVTGGTVTVAVTAPSTAFRYATIYYDSQLNAIGVQYGALSSSIRMPDFAYQMPLAAIYLTAGMTSITASLITDLRSLSLNFGYLNYFNGATASGTNINCAMARSVSASCILFGATALGLTSFQIGVPVALSLTNGAGSAVNFQLVATTPNGSNYVVRMKGGGVLTTVSSATLSLAANSTYVANGSSIWNGSNPVLDLSYT